MTITAGTQVSYRSYTAGESLTLVRTGIVISIQGQKALVQFPADNVRKQVSLSELQPSSARYPGRARVNINVSHR